MRGSALRRGMVLLVFCWALGAAYGAHITVSVSLDGPTSCWVGDDLNYAATASYTLDAATQEEVANGATVTTEYTWTYTPATRISGGGAQDSELEIVYPATTPGGYHTVSVSYHVVVHLVGGGTISGVGSDDIAVAVRRFTVSLSTDKGAICAGAGDSDVHKAHLTATVSDGVDGPYANRTVTFSTQCDFYQTGPALSVTEGVTDANGVVQTTLTSGDGVANCLVTAACEGTTDQHQVAFEEPTKELHTLDLETGYDILHLSPDGESQCRVALTVTYGGVPVPAHPLEWSFSFWAQGAGETPTYTGQGPGQYGALSSMAAQTDANGQATALYTSGTTTGTVQFQVLDGAVYTSSTPPATWSKTASISYPLTADTPSYPAIGGLFARQACQTEGYPVIATDRVWHDCYVCVRLPNDFVPDDFYVLRPGEVGWTLVSNDGSPEDSGPGWHEYRRRWLTGEQFPNAAFEWRVTVSLAPGGELLGNNFHGTYRGTFTPYNVVAGNRQSGVLFYTPGYEVEIPWGIEHGYPPSCACPGGDEFSVCAKVFDLNGNLVWHKHQNGITLEDGGNQRGHKEGNIIWEGQRLGNGTPTAGVYTYRILVDHVSTLGLESEGMCDQEELVGTPTIDREKSGLLSVSGVDYTHFEIDLIQMKVKAKVSYTLSSDANQCFLKVYDPTLTMVYNEALETTHGTHETAQFEFAFDLQTGIGNYYAVVWARETTEAGYANRDQQGKWALQRGDIRNYYPRAENWQSCDPRIAPLVDAVKGKQETYYLFKRYAATTHTELGGRAVLDPRFASREDAIILIAGHGNPGFVVIGPENPGPGEVNASLYGNSEAKKLPGDMAVSDYDLHQCCLVIYQACRAGLTDESNGSNLLDASVEQGAEVAIGFTSDLYLCLYDEYAITFFDAACVQHKTLIEAHRAALDAVWDARVDDSYGGFDSMTWRGPETLDYVMIVPARYAQHQ